MNIYDALKKDHEKVVVLLGKLVRASSEDRDQWMRLVDRIRDELIPHARAEEAVFYNAIRELDPDNGVVRSAYLEHAKAETDLRALQAMKAIDVNWTALAQRLKTDITHHIEEEQSKVFAVGRRLFSDEEAQMIGKAFEELKPKIKEQGVIGTTVDMIANMLPQRLVPSFMKVWDSTRS